MRVHSQHLSKPAYMRSCAQIYRQEGRLRIFLLEIFEDSKRLHQRRAVAVEQSRHNHLWIERPIGCVELVALEQIERNQSQTTAPNMCRARATAVTSELPIRGMTVTCRPRPTGRRRRARRWRSPDLFPRRFLERLTRAARTPRFPPPRWALVALSQIWERDSNDVLPARIYRSRRADELLNVSSTVP
jgi:hypothetical protein